MKKTLLFILLCFGYLFSEAQITASIAPQNPNCFGQCDGQATISVAGGTAPFTYTLMPSSMTGTFTSSSTLLNLCAGSYSVIIADQTQATNIYSFSLMQPSPLNMFANSSNDCGGTCSGTG